LHYLKETQNDRLKHLTTLRQHRAQGYMWLDRFSLRNLEVLHSTSPGGVALVDVVDRTQTPMGARLLKSWLAFPLLDVDAIAHRHATVAELMEHPEILGTVRSALEGVHDPERLLARMAKGMLGPRELFQLAEAQRIAEALANALGHHGSALRQWSQQVRPLEAWRKQLSATLADDLPVAVHKGGFIRPGVLPELDELRVLQRDGKQYLLDLQQREADATGISSLKVAYNNVFGYYLEVRNTHKDKVPNYWVRKQTLTGAERYITQELKTYEEKILGAEGRIQTLEEQLYQELLRQSMVHLSDLQYNARQMGQLDVLAGFAVLAQERRYQQPRLHAARQLTIRNGRHPVIEQVLQPGEAFVANDLELNDAQRIRMITGPNMSGKSAYLRQNALISILAQAGSFVPADFAELPLLDRIFVRVGASDNLSAGESTFMVEMTEAAQILNNLTAGSLVILDEIGRGTATYDGVSIAWAIAEYLHEHPAQPMALFATHYHELNEMEQQFKGMANYHVAVQENTDRVIFLRTLQPGGSAHSFGIHVARMAGLPKLVIHRAERMLKHLEKINAAGTKPTSNGPQDLQLNFFQVDDPQLAAIKEEITGLDINALTPVEALMLLHQMKKRLAGN
jgi:DNA mismatch repair protein MutS